ncbi:MAG: SpoIIE family protein phosphatase [Bacteroidetes bacterium]|nr:SpoIIE family protein phosphatase [Bacteroidota bacterium]
MGILKKEKEVIQREKSELVDSINYAKRIQTALLPSSSIIKERIGENFILYIPKDIVSGDFYWVETAGDWIFFAACDCTGHGVPGALINIVCNNALNRAIKEYGITDPAKILDKVAELIVESIGLDGEVRDGMDASICSFNKVTRELFWAGANIPLWIARTGAIYELLEFKPDKQAIGLTENRLPFTTQKIEIQKDDILYMASDGFADQFGGEYGKKLTRKKFKEILMMQRGKSLQEQQVNLLKFHNEYKGKGDQIDDILVMGIRIEK